MSQSYPIIPEGSYSIHNVLTGTSLDDGNFATAQGSPVFSWQVNGGTNQTWHISPGMTDNTYYLKAANFDDKTWLGFASDTQGQGLIVTVTDTPVEWTITMVDPTSPTSPYYVKSPNGFRMDVSQGLSANGTPVILWTPNDASQSQNQQWKIQLTTATPVIPNGPYNIQNDQTLTIASASGTTEGAPITGNKFDFQLDQIWHWNFQPSTGTYLVTSAKDNTMYMSAQIADRIGDEQALAKVEVSKTAHPWILRRVIPPPRVFPPGIIPPSVPSAFYIYSWRGLCVDLDNGSNVDGTPIILYPKHPDGDGHNQRWRIFSPVGPPMAPP